MVRWSRNLAALIVCFFVPAGWTGRTPSPVSTHSPRDDQLRCGDINDEIHQANSRMVALSVVPFLVFAMDFKYAPQT